MRFSFFTEAEFTFFSPKAFMPWAVNVPCHLVPHRRAYGFALFFIVCGASLSALLYSVGNSPNIYLYSQKL